MKLVLALAVLLSASSVCADTIDGIAVTYKNPQDATFSGSFQLDMTTAMMTDVSTYGDINVLNDWASYDVLDVQVPPPDSNNLDEGGLLSGDMPCSGNIPSYVTNVIPSLLGICSTNDPSSDSLIVTDPPSVTNTSESGVFAMLIIGLLFLWGLSVLKLKRYGRLPHA